MTTKFLVKLISLVMFLPFFAEAQTKLYTAFVSEEINTNFGNKDNNIAVIYQKNIDADDNGKVEQPGLINHIKNLPKNLEMIILDWEGKSFQKLLANSKEQDDMINNYLSAIELARNSYKSRKVKIGYYGLPSKRAFFKSNVDGEYNQLKELFEVQNVVFPSFYLFKKLPTKHSFSALTRRLENILKYTCKYNKEIYPFITHRWHPNSVFMANHLISKKTFKKYIGVILNANHNGCRVNGIIWWGADKYWYEKFNRMGSYAKREKHRQINQDIKKQGGFQEYVANQLDVYHEILTQKIVRNNF